MQGPDLVSIVISGLIKPIILIVLVMLVYICLHKRSAALKHFCLMMGLISLLVLPVSAYFIPEMMWSFPFSEYLFNHLPFSWQEYLIKTSYTAIPSVLWQSLLIVYLLVSTSIMFYLLIGYAQVWKIYRSSSIVHDAETLELVNVIKNLFGIKFRISITSTEEITSPCVWGMWSPKILLPRNFINWTSDQKISVLMHELGHIHRYDAVSLFIVRMTCAIFWFLIPVWWMARKISANSEIACDDLIYRLGEKQVQYAEHLLQLADHSKEASAMVVPMSGHSEIYQRIMAVLDIKRPRQAVKSESIQYPVLIGILFVAVLASIDVIKFYPEKQLNNSGKLFNFSWARVVVTDSQDENIRIAEHAILVADELILQQKPLLITRITPEKEKINSDIMEEYKNHYHIDKMDIDSVDAIQVESLVSNSYPASSDLLSTYKTIRSVSPVYPEKALKKGITGNVRVEFDIDESGHAKNLRILESTPTGMFDESIIQSIQQSQYQWRERSPDHSSIIQDFHFQLDHRRKR